MTREKSIEEMSIEEICVKIETDPWFKKQVKLCCDVLDLTDEDFAKFKEMVKSEGIENSNKFIKAAEAARLECASNKAS